MWTRLNRYLAYKLSAKAEINLVRQSYADNIGTACRVCGSRSVHLLGVRPSVSQSVLFDRHTPLLRVCCCGPGGQETPIDRCTAGGPAVSSSLGAAVECGYSATLSADVGSWTDLLCSTMANVEVLFTRTTLNGFDVMSGAGDPDSKMSNTRAKHWIFNKDEPCAGRWIREVSWIC